MKINKIFNYLSNIFLIFSIVFMCICAIKAIEFKNNPEDAFVFGYKPIYVKTGSMHPTLQVNSVALVKKATYEEIKVDDIIVYNIDNKTIVHRVVEITDKGIQTKGDNNNSKDAYLLQPENIKGKVVSIFNISAVIIREIQTTFGFIKWVIFPIFSIIVIRILYKKVIPLIFEKNTN